MKESTARSVIGFGELEDDKNMNSLSSGKLDHRNC